MQPSADCCAQEVFDVVPMVMRAIRNEMRGARGSDLSVPMFRALNYAVSTPSASLTQVAAHLGVTLPSMSKMVDGLEARQLVNRQPMAGDRRKVTLTVTQKGIDMVAAARHATQTRLSEMLARLPAEQCDRIIAAMDDLRHVFGARPRPQG